MRWLSCVAISLCVSCLNVNEYGMELVRRQTQAKYLNAHNEIRQLVGSPNLMWSENLEDRALSHAERIAKHCDTGAIEDESGNYYQSWGNMITTPRQVVDRWGKEQGEHFRKIVDKNTIEVGCSFAICKDPSSLASSVIHVCHYRSTLLKRLFS